MYTSPYGSWYTPYFDSLAVEPVAGWESNEYTDLTNMCGPFGVGFAGDTAIWVRGCPYVYWTTKPVSEVYLRIPLPASANTLTGDDSLWVASLPWYDYVNMGASRDVIAPGAAPQIKGYAQISILDSAKQPIATFELRLSGDGGGLQPQRAAGLYAGRRGGADEERVGRDAVGVQLQVCERGVLVEV